jgi:hypothetical protein
MPVLRPEPSLYRRLGVALNCPLAAGAASGCFRPWRISDKADPRNYYGATAANGMLGVVLSRPSCFR